MVKTCASYVDTIHFFIYNLKNIYYSGALLSSLRASVLSFYACSVKRQSKHSYCASMNVIISLEAHNFGNNSGLYQFQLHPVTNWVFVFVFLSHTRNIIHSFERERWADRMVCLDWSIVPRLLFLLMIRSHNRSQACSWFLCASGSGVWRLWGNWPEISAVARVCNWAGKSGREEKIREGEEERCGEAKEAFKKEEGGQAKVKKKKKTPASHTGQSWGGGEVGRDQI